MQKGMVLTAVLPALFAWGTAVMAHTPSHAECAEARDFVVNAAISRDNGMDGTTFVAKLLDDFVAIRSFPVELRWFVQDQQDEALLLAAVTDVFERPDHPETHGRLFLDRCVGRI